MVVRIFIVWGVIFSYIKIFYDVFNKKLRCIFIYTFFLFPNNLRHRNVLYKLYMKEILYFLEKQIVFFPIDFHSLTSKHKLSSKISDLKIITESTAFIRKHLIAHKSFYDEHNCIPWSMHPNVAKFFSQWLLPREVHVGTSLTLRNKAT